MLATASAFLFLFIAAASLVSIAKAFGSYTPDVMRLYAELTKEPREQFINWRILQTGDAGRPYETMRAVGQTVRSPGTPSYLIQNQVPLAA